MGWDWDGIGSPGGRGYRAPYGAKNAILDGCSTVDSKLDYDGIGWCLMFSYGLGWSLMVSDGPRLSWVVFLS